MARTRTSLRIPSTIMDKVDKWAEEHGTTRTDAFLVLASIGLQALSTISLTKAEVMALVRQQISGEEKTSG